MAVFNIDGICPFYGYGSHIFRRLSGGTAVPFSGSLGEMPGDGISDRGNFSVGAGRRALPDRFFKVVSGRTVFVGFKESEWAEKIGGRRLK